MDTATPRSSFGPQFDLTDDWHPSDGPDTKPVRRRRQVSWVSVLVTGGVIAVGCLLVFLGYFAWLTAQDISFGYGAANERLETGLSRELAIGRNDLEQGKLIFTQRRLTEAEVQHARDNIDKLKRKIEATAEEAATGEQAYRDRFPTVQMRSTLESFAHLRQSIREANEELEQFEHWWDSLSAPAPPVLE